MSTRQNEEKRIAAATSVQMVEPDMVLGLGSGSTSEIMVHLLGERVRAGLQIRGAVPTSKNTRAIAESYGIPITTLDESPELDLTIDGADESDHALNLIKGGGGALLHEKIVAAASQRFIVIVDASKLVTALGDFKLPVEIIRSARRAVENKIASLGGKAVLRMKGDAPFITEEQNYILDCDFGAITQPAELSSQLDRVPGIVEHGLFVGMADVLIVGRDGGADLIQNPLRAPTRP